MSDGKKAHQAIRSAVFTQQIGYHRRKAMGSLKRLESMAIAMGLDPSAYVAAMAILEPPIVPAKPCSLEEANARALMRRAGAAASPWRGKAVPPKRQSGVQ